VLSVCVCSCWLVGPVWFFCVVDLLLFLSGVGGNGVRGLRETHAGLLQPVSDSLTAAHFPLVVFWDLWVVICVFRSCCVYVVRCCVAIVGVAELWIVLLLLLDLCWILSFLFQCA